MKLKTVALAALLTASLPALAMAQDNPATSNSSGTVNTQVTGNSPVGATNGGGESALGSDQDFDVFMQGFGSADFTSATSQIGSATTFHVIRISGMKNADSGRLNEAVTPHAQDMAGLHTGISANAQAKAALDAEGLTSDQVVWTETGADGSVNLYVSDFPKS